MSHRFPRAPFSLTHDLPGSLVLSLPLKNRYARGFSVHPAASQPAVFALSGLPVYLVASRLTRFSLGDMRACLAIVAVLLFADSARCADADRKQSDEESLRNYMTGEYDLIGRKVDSTVTYTGHVTLRDENGVLQVTRAIEGKTDKCVARFDTVAGADRIPVLRMHFHFDGKEYDATYRWQSDPDNYPRFTGYVYLAGTKSPGLEALFPIHR